MIASKNFFFFFKGESHACLFMCSYVCMWVSVKNCPNHSLLQSFVLYFVAVTKTHWSKLILLIDISIVSSSTTNVNDFLWSWYNRIPTKLHSIQKQLIKRKMHCNRPFVCLSSFFFSKYLFVPDDWKKPMDIHLFKSKHQWDYLSNNKWYTILLTDNSTENTIHRDFRD